MAARAQSRSILRRAGADPVALNSFEAHAEGTFGFRRIVRDQLRGHQNVRMAAI